VQGRGRGRSPRERFVEGVFFLELRARLMNRWRTSLLCGALALIGAERAAAASYVEVFTQAEAANGDAALTFLDAVAVSGSNAYAVLRDTSTADVGGVTAFNGSSFTTVSTPADWTATGSTNDIAASNGVGVVGGALRFLSFFDNAVYEIDLGTGAVSEAVSKSAFDALVGADANFTANFETLADGTIYALESATDAIVAVSPANALSVEISTSDFAALVGGTSLGGIGAAGNLIYLGSNNLDALVAWDVVAKTGATVLTTAEIEAVTDDVDGTVGFGDILAGADGLVYFYETDSDFILAFDPADPVASLKAVITEAELEAGPGSDTINQLAFYGGRLAWTDQGLGFYQLVPEPASWSCLLLGLATAAARRRRR
jgi:hypothetical protein